MTILEPDRDGVGEPGTVIVSAALSVSAAQAWQALTEPAIVREWFGNVSVPFSQSGSTRLDFEDGDFFDIFEIELQPTDRVHYKWSFLGTSPPDSITWRILPEDIGCLVSVIDADPERSSEWMTMLKEGWMDFVHRLVDHLKTGQNTRYDWRRDFDGSIELPGSMKAVWDNLLAGDAIKSWAPFLCGGMSPQSQCQTTVEESSSARVANTSWEPPDSLHFDILHDQWSQPTNVTVTLNSRLHGTMLSVNHAGWEGLQADPAYGGRQRKKFAALWIDSLWRAKDIMTRIQSNESKTQESPLAVVDR